MSYSSDYSQLNNKEKTLSEDHYSPPLSFWRQPSQLNCPAKKAKQAKQDANKPIADT